MTNITKKPFFLLCKKVAERLKLRHIIIIGFLFRIAALTAMPNNQFPDSHTYIKAGAQLFENGVIVKHNVMPLYPILCGILNNFLLIKIADILFSVLTIYIIYQLSYIIFKKKTSALLSAFIAAVYPFFNFYATAALTETSYTLLLVSAFYMLYRQKFIIGAILLILSILERPTLDFAAPLIIFIFAYFVHKRSLSYSIKIVSYYIVIYILLFCPWWLHQYNKYDKFIRMNLADGIAWYSGNNPLNQSGSGVASDNGKPADVDFSLFAKIKDPYKQNQAMKKEAFDFIINNPDRFIKLAALKFCRLWRLYPYAPEYEKPLYIIISVTSYGSVLLFFLLSTASFIFIKKNRVFSKKLLPVFFLITYFTLVHMVLISSLRYRFPIEPFLIIIASYGFIFLFNKITKHNDQKAE
ncbi:MAG: glycosyltransferase family 39 protein [Deltaproteobacteria bacterium]|nr:glycosyltransferase family 39 protein [Deltaproteobacteria bacterium]